MAKCADCQKPISDGVRCSSCFDKLLKKAREATKARQKLDEEERKKNEQ